LFTPMGEFIIEDFTCPPKEIAEVLASGILVSVQGANARGKALLGKLTDAQRERVYAFSQLELDKSRAFFQVELEGTLSCRAVYRGGMMPGHGYGKTGQVPCSIAVDVIWRMEEVR
jgi:hypothetical protein